MSFAAAEVGQGFSCHSHVDGITIHYNANLNAQSPGFSAAFWMRGNATQSDPFQSMIVEN